MNKNLKDFLTSINKTHSISRAADELYVTQPYVSQTIHKYEIKFGTPLLQRNKDSTVLTYAGQRLLAYLIEQDKNYVHLEREMANIAKFKTGIIRLGTNHPLGRYFLPTILPQFHQIYPDLQVQFIETPTSKAAYLLDNDELDIFYGMGIEKRSITFQSLAASPVYLIISKQVDCYDPRLCGVITPLTNPQLLNNQEIIMTRSDSKFQQQVTHFITDQQLTLKTVAIVPDMDLATRIVSHQLGLTFTTREALIDNNLLAAKNVNIYKVPETMLAIEKGVSYKTEVTAPIQTMIELLLTYLKEDV